MRTGRSDRTAQAGQENCRELTGSRGKRKRVLVSLSVVAVVLAAVMVGVAIYHTPENRLRRQLDLGNRYLEEQQYEQAVLAFEQAIAIDDRCLEAYTGSVVSFVCSHISNAFPTQVAALEVSLSGSILLIRR